MANTLLEKLVEERHKRRKKQEEKNPNRLKDPLDNAPTTTPIEDLARELRNYFFGTGIISYFIPEITVSYKNLKQAFIDLEVAKNYQEADDILQELNNFKEGYNTVWQPCQLEIKNIIKGIQRIEDNKYLISKSKAPFPKPKEIKGKNSPKEILRVLSPFANMDKLYPEPLNKKR